MINEKMYALGAKGSAIRELFEYGKKKKAEIGEDNVYDYSLGNPSIPTPKKVTDTLINLLNTVDPTILHGYTSAVGDANSRNKIAEYLNKTYNTDIDLNHIYLTCGAAASLTISLSAILNEGEEVIAIAPFFPEYRVFTEQAKGKLVSVLSDTSDFQFDLSAIEKAINQNTKALIINSPNNPTGVIYKEEKIIALAKLLEDKQKEYNHPIYLISDEPYRELIYSDIKYPFITNYYNNSIVCYSFSKGISLPGERIGYIIVNNKCEDDIKVYKAVCGAGRSLGYVCAPAMFQFMIPDVLGYTSNLDEYKVNREILYNALTEIGYEVVYPDGAFYIFFKALEQDAKAFSEVAKKFNLLLVPSDSFGINGYIRIAYCVKKDMIERSIPAFKELYHFYKKN